MMVLVAHNPIREIWCRCFFFVDNNVKVSYRVIGTSISDLLIEEFEFNSADGGGI